MVIRNLLESVKRQGIYNEVKIEDIAVNIFLNDGTLLPFSFILDEDKEYLNILCTDSNGFEKINLINKECILRISVVYADELASNENNKNNEIDKMVI